MRYTKFIPYFGRLRDVSKVRLGYNVVEKSREGPEVNCRCNVDGVGGFDYPDLIVPLNEIKNRTTFSE